MDVNAASLPLPLSSTQVKWSLWQFGQIACGGRKFLSQFVQCEPISFFSLRYVSNEADVKGRSVVVDVILVFPLVDMYHTGATCTAYIVGQTQGKIAINLTFPRFPAHLLEHFHCLPNARSTDRMSLGFESA